MATPAAILETVVRANTTAAVRDLRQYDSYLHRVDKSSVSTTARTSTLGKATGTLGSKMRSAAGYAAGAAAAYLSIAQAKAAVTTTQDLAKTTAGLNRNLGFTVKEGSRWASVAKSRDIDAKALTMSFTTLSRRVVEAGHAIREGGGAAETAMVPFTRLGLSQKDVLKGSQDLDAFLPKLANSFGEAEGGAKRQASAQQLLGRGYATILPLFADGAKGLKEQELWADKYGTTLNKKTLAAQMDLVSALRESKVAWLGIQVTFAKAVTPALEKANDVFQRIAKIMGSDKLTGTEKWQRVGDIISKWADKALNAFTKVLPTLVERAGETAPKIAEAFVKGFLNSGAWGRLFLGAWLIKMMGGWALFTNMGKGAGKRFGLGLAVGLALALPALIEEAFKLGTKIGEAIKGGLGGDLADIISGATTRELTPKELLKSGAGLDQVAEAYEAMGMTANQAANRASKAWHKMFIDTDKSNQGVERSTRKASDTVKNESQRAGREVDEAGEKIGGANRDAGKSFDKFGKEAKRGTDTVGRSVGDLDQTVADGLRNIGTNTSSALKAFGAKPVNFAIVDGKKTGTSGLQKGGVAVVPGYGTGDKVPAMLEPGEVVLNRKAVSAMGGADRANSINRAVPRFAKGGKAKGGTSAMDAMVALTNEYEQHHYPYVYGGGHGGFVNAGAPVDCSGFVSDVLHAGGLLDGAPMVSGALANWGKPGTGPLTVYANSGHTLLSLNGKFAGTSGSNPGGGAGWIEGGLDAGYLSAFAKRTADVAGAVGSMVAGVAEKIKREVIEGPDGPLKDLGQKSLDKARGAANKFIASKTPSGSFGGGDAQVGDVGVPGGGSFSVPQMESLWLKVNKGIGDAHLMAAIGMAESSGNPNVTNSIGARGLWQIIPSTASAFNLSYDRLTDPAYNALGAGRIFQGQGLGAWEAYTNGDYQQFMAKGGVVQKLAGGGIVGDFLDSWRQAEGGKGDQRKALSAAKKQVKKMDVPGMAGIEFGKELMDLEAEAAKFAEYASNAGSRGTEDDNGVTTGDIFKGHSELEWLGGAFEKTGFRGELQALHEFRNKLAKSLRAVAKMRKVIDKLMKQAERRLKDLRKAIREGEQDRRGLEKAIETATDKKEESRAAMQARLDKELKKDRKDQDEDLIASLRKGIHSKSTEKEALQDALKKLNKKQTARNALAAALAPGSDGLLQTLADQRSTYGEAASALQSSLDTVQGVGGDTKPMKILPQLGEIGGDIFDVQQRLHEMGLPKTASTDLTEGQQFTNEYLMQLLREANLRTAVSQAQYGVFQNFAGGFAEGGYIPGGKWGVVGEAGPEVISGPNTITPMGGEGVSVIVNGDIINTPPGMQPVEVRGAKTIVQQGSRGYGRRPLGGAKGY